MESNAHRKVVRRVAMLSSIALGLGLAGCGGGSSKKESSPTTTSATTTSATTTGTSSGGGTTKPGAKLKLGETARVKFKPLSAPTGNKKTYDLDVAVLEIEKGSIADDFKNVDLEADQKTSTPFYVSVKVTNAGAEVPVKNDDPDIRFDGIDDRGQEQGSVTFFGTFERCDDASAQTPFSNGESYESCLVYLVPGGGSIQQVNWSGSDEYVLKPVTWR
jgi:hypothetical protein